MAAPHNRQTMFARLRSWVSPPMRRRNIGLPWGWIGLGLLVLTLGVAGTLLRERHPRATALPVPTPSSLPLAGVTVILDPGHGGADPGAVRNGVCEAALTYRTAAELADSIRQQGGRVLFTVRSRDLDPRLAATEPPPQIPTDAVLAATGAPLRLRRDDTPRPLWLRAAVARHLWASCARPDPRRLFFLSLHYDDYHRSSLTGGLVCIDRRMRAVPPLARLLAARLCADHWARPDVYHGLRGLADTRLGVLDPAYNPVPERALLELATISNPFDARCAADPAWRQGMVEHVTEVLIALQPRGSLSQRQAPAVQ